MNVYKFSNEVVIIDNKRFDMYNWSLNLKIIVGIIKISTIVYLPTHKGIPVSLISIKVSNFLYRTLRFFWWDYFKVNSLCYFNLYRLIVLQLCNGMDIVSWGYVEFSYQLWKFFLGFLIVLCMNTFVDYK